jgi:hypothetical protein
MQRDEQARLAGAKGEGLEEGVELGEAMRRSRVLQSLAGVEESTVEPSCRKSPQDLSAAEESRKRPRGSRG